MVFFAMVPLSVVLFGCTSAELVKTAVLHFTQEKNLSHHKVGKPYQIKGKWYHPKEDYNYKEVGMASWYGGKFHGRKTANGERFDKNKISAAHRTLPMPSMVRVTNLENGKSMLIRVNDRGPFIKDRIIDLSEKAAGLLGMKKKGVARVQVELDRIATAELFRDREGGDAIANRILNGGSTEEIVLTSTSPSSTPAKIHDNNYQIAASNAGKYSGRGYYVQVGAYGTPVNASEQSSKFNGISPVLVEPVRFSQKKLYRVRLGPFVDMGQAENNLSRAKELGFNDAIIVAEN